MGNIFYNKPKTILVIDCARVKNCDILGHGIKNVFILQKKTTLIRQRSYLY